MAKKTRPKPSANESHRSLTGFQEEPGYALRMPWAERVPQGPLTTLWDHNGDLHAVRMRDLESNDISKILDRGRVRFVIAHWVGPLRWTEVSECYKFWKEEVKPHLCQELRGHMTPAGYCYSASEWHLATGEVVILLEMDH